MKQLPIILLLLLLLLQFNSYAQGENFAHIDAEWYHDRTGDDGQFFGYTKSTVVKDSVIDGKTCRVINSMIVQYPGTSQNIDTIQEEAAMIVYTTPDTVYYLNKEIGRFIPLYVFNVDVGDTISYRTPFAVPGFPPEDTIFRILITNVSITDVGGVPLKTISYTPLDMWGFTWGGGADGYYIERIGTRGTGLLSHEPQASYTGASYPPSLRCYIDGEVSYPSPIEDGACDYVRGLNMSISDNTRKAEFQLYPNPAGDYVRIQNAFENQPIISVEIYDLVGRIVKIPAFENTDQEQMLSIADLPSGNYILKLRSKEQSINRKLSVR